MRRFIITQPKFKGSFSLVYNTDGQLVLFDAMTASITEEQLQYLLKILPVKDNQIAPAFDGIQATVVEEDFVVTWEMFYKIYPYKRNAGDGQAAFERLSKVEQVQAWAAAKDYVDYCNRNKWYNAKIAAGWLRSKEFLNDWKKL